ncbi:MAG: hypothetical protein ACI4BI_05265 [Anaerotardibacter sp.]
MKKSNIIIAIVAILAACFFLWLWYYLQFNLVDNPLDLVLTIVWWALVAIICVAIHKVEKTRQERIRTCFVGAGVLFNSEAGVVGFGTSNNATEKIEEILKNLEYNFNREEPPADEYGNSAINYKYVVRSVKYEQDKDNNAEPVWEGEVVNLTTQETTAFENKEQLVALIP